MREKCVARGIYRELIIENVSVENVSAIAHL